MTLLDAPPAPIPRVGTVQWYVPYVGVHPETAANAPADAIWVDVSGSPYAYYEALLGWWDDALAGGHHIAILEHDVVCRPDIVEAFETCPEPWCVYSYAEMCHDACREAWRNMLGCTRFRYELIAAVPNAVRDIPEIPEKPRQGGWDWHNLCDGLAGEGVKDGKLDQSGEMPPWSLRGHGYTHHWHTPHAHHHSETARLARGENADGTARD